MPKRFRFALQAVLEHRKLLEEGKRGLVGRRRADRDGALAAAELVTSALARGSRVLRESAGSTVTSDPRVFDWHLRLLGRALVERQRASQDCETLLAAARAELVAAATARRVLEKLEERQRRRFDAEAARDAEREAAS